MSNAHACSRLLAELKLNEADIFEICFNGSPIGASLTLADGRLGRVNAAFARMLGYEPQEMEGRSYTDFTHPDDLMASKQCVDTLLSGRQDVYRFEKRYLTKAGDTVWVLVHTRLRRNTQGRPLCFMTHIVDITEQKRLEEAQRKEEAELETILASIADGILAVGSDGRVIRYNRRFQELWRIPDALAETRDDQVLLRYVLDQLADPEGFLAKVRELYASTERSLDTIFFKDGRILERYSSPMLREGAIVGRVWSFRDHTERRRMEDEIAAHNREIEALVRALSHDMRSPLVTITGFTTLLKEDAAARDEPAMSRQLGMIEDAAKRALRMLDDLLDYWRMGQSTEVPTDVLVADLVQDALDVVGSQLAERGVAVEVTGEPVQVHGRRRELARVLQNLLENAGKFMGDQPEPYVQIGWQLVEAARPMSAAAGAGARRPVVRVWVRDNGTGFDPAMRDRLFVPYQRLDRRQSGSGLGLAGVRRIVEAHGGRVWAESDGPGHGACFWIELPATEQSSADNGISIERS
jgi:PAS domain S-box-containing protein